MEKGKILYHYTDYKAFDGILNQGILRVNNVLNMNDATEMRLFMTGISNSASAWLLEEGYESEAQRVREIFSNELLHEFKYSAYAACFSLLEDDASQWERYGYRGRGVCIGFNYDALKKIVGYIGPISLLKVFYKDDMSDHPLTKQFVSLIMENKDITTDDIRVRELLDMAWLSAAAFKHPSFRNESEVRLTVSPLYSGLADVEPQYHISEGRIKKYYALEIMKYREELGIDLDELIDCILIGPESTQSKPILQDFLKDNNMGCLSKKVYHSECPLRRPTV